MLRLHRLSRALGAGSGEQVVVPDVAAGPHRRRSARRADDDDVLERVKVPHLGVHRLFDGSRTTLTASPIHCDQCLGRGYLHALAYRGRSESTEDHVVRGADPGAGQHRDDHLRDHRQKNPHHVALAHAEALQTVGEQLDVPMQIRISDRPLFALLAPPVIGDSVTETGLDMAVQAVGGNVQPAVREPRVERRAAVIEPLGEGGVPAQQRPCLVQPEAHRVASSGVPVHLVAGDEAGGRGEPLDRQEAFKVLF